MKYKKFKLMLMKGGLNFFIENIKNSENNDFNYYLKYFEFKIKKHNMIIIHNINNKHRNKMPIDKMINYTSEIMVKLNFGVFEKLIHEQLKLTKLEKSNILRLNEYADLSFEDLLDEDKYLPELNTIKEIADDFLKNQNEINNPYFLFYSRKRIKSEKNKIFSSKKNLILFDDNKPIGEIKEEDEDKDIHSPQAMDVIKNDEIKTKIDINNKNSDNDIIKIGDAININNEIFNINKKKKKSKKIKNMIIISKKTVKEEKGKRRFTKLISQGDFYHTIYKTKENY